MKFSLIHPSRERADLAYKNIMDILSKAKTLDLEYIVVIDNTDKLRSEYERVIDAINKKYPKVTLLVAGSNNCVQALNCGAAYSTGDILVYVAEDFVFPNHWDQLILDAAKGNDDFVMWVSDGIQPRIMTSCILSRKYFEYLGYVYFPGYFSMYADDDYTAVAMKLDKIIYAKHILIQHKHPSVPGGLPRDTTFQRQNDPKHYESGKKLFEERKKRNFDL